MACPRQPSSGDMRCVSFPSTCWQTRLRSSAAHSGLRGRQRFNKMQESPDLNRGMERRMENFPVLVRKDRKPIRYLVVDDSVFARKNVAKMVESFGGEIAGEAGDGCTAITEYDRTGPDMVLMDITMPQMEGIEAAERIVRAHPQARIVMVSSVGYQENIVAALQKGARHFVQKPVKAEILYEVIKYVMGDDAAVATPAAQGN